MSVCRIATFNVRGIGSMDKRLEIFKYIREKENDICMLQETHSTKKVADFWKSQWSGNYIASHGTSNSGGTAILCKRNSKVKIINTKVDESREGRGVLIEIEFEEQKIAILGIYAPNEDRPEFFEKMSHLLIDSKYEKKILCGDFNVVYDESLDKKGGLKTTKKAQDKLKKK